MNFNKILDNSKKKIFNIDLFDLILIGIFFAVLLSIFLFLIRKRDSITATVKITNLSYLYSQRSVPAWYADQFKEGLVEKDGLGRTVAEILSVRSYDYGLFSKETWEDEKFEKEAKKALFLTVKLTTIYSPRSDQHTFKGKPVLIGEIVRLQLNPYLTEGVIVGIEGVDDTREKEEIIIEALLNDYKVFDTEIDGVPPHIVDTIKVGDSIKDSQNNQLVEIIDKKVKPAKITTQRISGEKYITFHPTNKEVMLTLKIYTSSLNENYYAYEDIKLTIGSTLPLHFLHLTIFPTITKINSDI